MRYLPDDELYEPGANPLEIRITRGTDIAGELGLGLWVAHHPETRLWCIGPLLEAQPATSEALKRRTTSRVLGVGARQRFAYERGSNWKRFFTALWSGDAHGDACGWGDTDGDGDCNAHGCGAMA